tara:strand:- start:495 stop:734 length:240 start_codon:yes stop_codon:yes gene_type:complete
MGMFEEIEEMVTVERINTINDFMSVCASIIQMDNPEEADEAINRVENQVVDWMVDDDTRVSINQMIEAVNASIGMREVI